MKETIKINGLTGFGFPGLIGEKGNNGTPIFVSEIEYSEENSDDYIYVPFYTNNAIFAKLPKNTSFEEGLIMILGDGYPSVYNLIIENNNIFVDDRSKIYEVKTSKDIANFQSSDIIDRNLKISYDKNNEKSIKIIVRSNENDYNVVKNYDDSVSLIPLSLGINEIFVYTKINNFKEEKKLAEIVNF